MRFKRGRRGAVTAELDAQEALVLRDLFEQVAELLEDEEPAPPVGAAGPVGADEQDELFAALADLGRVRPTPADPALARLLPDAYATDSEEGRTAAEEFRRFTEGDLRAGKVAAARLALATMPAAGGRISLGKEAAQAWLAALNDVRLALGARLGVTADTDLGPPDDDPRAAAYGLYGWLGWVEELLVGALSS